MQKVPLPKFHYFMEYYVETINAGGSFSREDLVDLFKKYEKPECIRQLLEESYKLNKLLEKEDWEIDKDILKLIDKNGRNNLKNWIGNIKSVLEV